MIITDIKPCAKSNNRCNIYTDGAFSCALFLDTIEKRDLCVGKALNEKELEEIVFEDDCKKCLSKASALLGVRARSKKEIKDKLKEKGFNKEHIEYAITRLAENGYIDDESFAKEYAEYLMKKGYGGFAVKQRLFQKGIDRETAEKIVNALNDSGAAYEYGKRAYAKYVREEDEKKRQNKFFAAMQRHGFDYDTAKSVYERLEND